MDEGQGTACSERAAFSPRSVLSLTRRFFLASPPACRLAPAATAENEGQALASRSSREPSAACLGLGLGLG